jgi:uncharacterized protein (UPF0332 family)
MKDGLRYLNNANEILKGIAVEDSTYADVKLVREACGTAYLAILMAIDEYLLKKGMNKKDFQGQWTPIERHYKNIWRFMMENYCESLRPSMKHSI